MTEQRQQRWRAWVGPTILLACVAAVLAGDVADAQQGGGAIEQLRVVWEEDPAHHARISWTTAAAPGAATVHYDTQPRQGQPGAYAFTVTTLESGHYDGEDTPLFHHAELEGLEPSTRYYFTVEVDGETSPELWFETAPVDARRVRLLYGGDSRSDWEDRRRMNQRMAQLVEQDPEILALWHGGDFVDEGGDWNDWDAWLDDHTLTITSEGRILPVIPTRGNHERSGGVYNNVFGTPGADRLHNYFTTQMGPHARLLTLDSEASMLGDQRDWLERELIDAQQSRWILAGYHTPAWPAVKIAGPALYHWVPLFERYRVDLVCENDGHALKRTVPILDEQQDPDGVVYVGEGGLGVKQRTPDPERWFLKEPGVTMSAHHVQVLTIEPDRLAVEAIGMDGEVLDSWERAPRPERMIAPFTIESFEQLNERKFVLTLSHGVDPATLTPESISTDPPRAIEKLFNGKVLSEATIFFEEYPEPGQTYTLDLSSVRDLSGRELEDATFTFTAAGEPAVQPDMGEDMSAGAQDMGAAPDTPTDPSPDMSAGADMSGAGESAGGEEGDDPDDDTGCATTSPSSPPAPAAPLGLALLGVFGARARRRR